MSGMLIAAASVLGSIGVCSAFGVKSNYIVLDVISFLVLMVMEPSELMKSFRSCIGSLDRFLLMMYASVVYMSVGVLYIRLQAFMQCIIAFTVSLLKFSL